jgi:hypothetical protein
MLSTNKHVFFVENIAHANRFRGNKFHTEIKQ